MLLHVVVLAEPSAQMEQTTLCHMSVTGSHDQRFLICVPRWTAVAHPTRASSLTNRLSASTARTCCQGGLSTSMNFTNKVRKISHSVT